MVKRTDSKPLERIDMSNKVKTDWEKAELAYRAGVKTVAQIAVECGIKDSTLRTRAKRHGWKRDLSSRIKLKADELVQQDAIRAAARDIAQTDDSTIEENAKLTASVRLSHRKDIDRARNATMTLLEELEAMIGVDNRERLDELFLRIVGTGKMTDEQIEDAMKAYERVTSFGAHVGSMQRLSDTMTKLIALERQAWGLDEDTSNIADPLEVLLTTIARSNNNSFGIVSDDPEYDTPAPTNTLAIVDDIDNE